MKGYQLVSLFIAAAGVGVGVLQFLAAQKARKESAALRNQLAQADTDRHYTTVGYEPESAAVYNALVAF